MCFRILVAVLGHISEYRFGVSLKYRQLEQQRRVEHCIRLLLERIDPFFLAPSHRGTTGNCLTCRITAVAEVTHDASDEAHVGCRNPVMVVEVNGGKR